MMRIILLHHAGGDKYSFREYMDLLKPELMPIALELPGRGDRFGEPLLDEMEDITNDLMQQLHPYLDEPYVILGNSMGALAAYLLTKSLIMNDLSLPKHIFLTSRRCPDSYADYAKIAHLEASLFWEGIQKYGGCPQALIDHPELRELFEPILRADFKALENFTPEKPFKMPVSATVIYGTKDRISLAEAEGWSNHFKDVQVIPHQDGGHFFLFDNAPFVINIIKNTIGRTS